MEEILGMASWGALTLGGFLNLGGLVSLGQT